MMMMSMLTEIKFFQLHMMITIDSGVEKELVYSPSCLVVFKSLTNSLHHTLLMLMLLMLSSSFLQFSHEKRRQVRFTLFLPLYHLDILPLLASCLTFELFLVSRNVGNEKMKKPPVVGVEKNPCFQVSLSFP